MKRISTIRLGFFLAMLICLVAAWPLRTWLQSRVAMAMQQPKGQTSKTIDDRLKEYGEAARGRLRPYFMKLDEKYPPHALTFIGIKDEDRLDVYLSSSNRAPTFLRSYRILAASGELGPKLREGDQQVPEGIYRIELLNPNSSYHLSMRVSYPNEFDRAQAKKEGRSNLGGDIMIHGNAVSVGCLAMGDEASEDLFVLAADVGIENITVLLVPVDLRLKSLPATTTNLPAWTGELYQLLKRKLDEYPLPTSGKKN